MSDQSPRDALESAIGMIDTYDVVEGDVVPQRELWDVVNAAREFLAAHPVEPAPVVTDEAVENAEREYEKFGATMRDALEAALPHLAPQPIEREAVREEIRAGLNSALCNGGFPETGWSPSAEVDRITDAVLALLNGAES